MSYVLIKEVDQFFLIDNSAITKGAKSRGMTVKYKTKKGLSTGTFIDFGTFTEMDAKKKQMEEEMNGKKKRGRKKKEMTIGFTIHPPHGGMIEDEGEDTGENLFGGNEMMEEEEEEMTSKRTLRKRLFRAPSMREDSPRIDSDTSPLSSPIRRSSPVRPSISITSQKGTHQGSVDTSDLRLLLQEQLAPLSLSLQYLKRSVTRLEDTAADDTNAIEGINHKERDLLYILVRLLEERDRNIANNLEKVASNLEKVVDSLPDTSKDFDYKYIAKDLVDLHDENENLLIFATRMDELLFPNERHLRLERRDPRKVKWLNDLLCHRRKISLGPDRTQRMKQVRNRLNGNVYKFIHKKPSIPPPSHNLPRSRNGRFISTENTVVNNDSTLGPTPVLVNGVWMIPVTSQTHSQSSSILPITYSTPTTIGSYTRNNSTNRMVLHSPSLPPRISNQSPYDNSIDDNLDGFMGDWNRENPNLFDDFD